MMIYLDTHKMFKTSTVHLTSVLCVIQLNDINIIQY